MKIHTILLVGLLCVVSGAAPVGAQQLSVKSATNKAVQLEWTGAAVSSTLERSSPQGYKPVAPGKDGQFTDTTIDPFGTYKYRINTGGKLSNEVTVGPPPRGVTNAAPAPANSQLQNYGAATAVALDENGDPVIAFEWVDPNGDGDASDTEVRFVRWDRATYKWIAPVHVVTTGPMTDQGTNPIAIACDRSNGTVAILAPVGDNLDYSISSDHGATWKNSPVTVSGGTPHAVSMVIASGQLFFAVNAEQLTAYVTGSVTDSSSWKTQAILTGAGWKAENNSNIPLLLDAAGKPVLAFFESQQDGDGRRYVLWQPGQPEPTEISKGSQDTPDVALTFNGKKFGALLTAQLDSTDSDHGVWYTQSSNGTSWSQPVRLPVDGPRTTNAPVALAMDSKGGLVAAFGSNQGSGGAACNAPTVSRSPDGATWKACGLGQAAGADFSPQPANLHVLEAPNDAAYVVWQEQAESRYNPGVLVWHEH